MVTGQRVTVTLTGGAPWGFRLQGGGNYPLEVAKIRKNSHACQAGLQEGDVVLAINGHPTSGRTHSSAMDVVDMASGNITFEVARTGQGPSQPLDPQRQPRIIPMISAPEDTGRGIVTSAHANYSTTSGNTRTDVHTDQYVVNTGDGRKVTKTVTEQRVTRFPGSAGMSPAVSHTSMASGEHVSRSANRSPLMWHPSSQSNVDEGYRQTSHSPVMWRPPSQASNDYVSRSANRSPVSWQPPSQSSTSIEPVSQNRSPAAWQPSSNLQKSQSLLDVHFGHRKGASPSPARSISPRPKPSGKKNKLSKENIDPILACEQAKWEKIHSHDTPLTPKYGGAYETHKLEAKIYAPPKMNDPSYPMFEVPKTVWSPPRIVEPMATSPGHSPPSKKWAPPVAPKPTKTSSSSPIPWGSDERYVAGSDKHYPGMIRPPQQPNVAPAPPPPPMPVFPLGASQMFNVVPFDNLRKSASADDVDGHHRPDHLPVFAPRVVFTPEGCDSGMMSPDRHDEEYLLHRTDDNLPGDISDDTYDSGKLFSDSAFYDDSTNRFPTIDEQMSMCKKIAQSLTSFANKRARGARMFAKRQRKADKWIHDQSNLNLTNPRRDRGGSEYSSSVGDSADIDELDSEFYHDEGGNRPLFAFRIPRISTQISDGQKMSMSKAEFERMRLAAPKVDHHSVSPNQCFTIAADLQKGGRNKGAKLFQKRQQRVEKFVIDETNVVRSPISPSTKLDYIVTHPQPPQGQKNPWNAAAQGDMSRAFTNMPPQMPMQPIPRHNLVAENQPRVLGGKNFNMRARGWGGTGPGMEQQSFYRDPRLLLAIADPNESHGHDVDRSTRPRSEIFDPDEAPRKLDQYGNYNNKMKAWPEQDWPEEKPMEFGDYNRRMKAWPEHAPPPTQPKPSVEQKDYNRRIKGFASQQQYEQPQQQAMQHGDYNQRVRAWPTEAGQTLPSMKTGQSISVQQNYNSLPRGFGSSPLRSCDL